MASVPLNFFDGLIACVFFWIFCVFNLLRPKDRQLYIYFCTILFKRVS